jgi:hypothetical protein
VIASSSCSMMAIHSGDRIRRRHEGYLCSDQLAVTHRSDCRVHVFVLQTAHQNSSVPTPRSTAVFTRSGCTCMRPGRIYLQTSRSKKSAWRREDLWQPAASRPSFVRIESMSNTCVHSIVANYKLTRKQGIFFLIPSFFSPLTCIGFPLFGRQGLY